MNTALKQHAFKRILQRRKALPRAIGGRAMLCALFGMMISSPRCGAQTVEAVLRAAQERCLMLGTGRRLNDEASLRTAEVCCNNPNFQLPDDQSILSSTLIQFPNGISYFPRDGELTKMRDVVLCLRKVAETMEDPATGAEFQAYYQTGFASPTSDKLIFEPQGLNENYLWLYTPQSGGNGCGTNASCPTQCTWEQQIPGQNVHFAVDLQQTSMRLRPVGRITEENWREKLKLLASNINQCQAISGWPTQVNFEISNAGWEGSMWTLSEDPFAPPCTYYKVNIGQAGLTFKSDGEISGTGLTGFGSGPTMSTVANSVFTVTSSIQTTSNLYYNQDFNWFSGFYGSGGAICKTYEPADDTLMLPHAAGGNSVSAAVGALSKTVPDMALGVNHAPLKGNLAVYVRDLQHSSMGEAYRAQTSASQLPQDSARMLLLTVNPGADLTLGNMQPEDPGQDIPSNCCVPPPQQTLHSSNSIFAAQSALSSASQWLGMSFDNYSGGAWTDVSTLDVKPMQTVLDLFSPSSPPCPNACPMSDPTLTGVASFELPLTPASHAWGGYLMMFEAGSPSPVVATNWLNVGAGIVCFPQFTNFFPTASQADGVAPYRVGELETRATPNGPVCIHLGRGKSDRNQVADNRFRWDGFGSPTFYGSPLEFDLVYETDCSKYTDHPLSDNEGSNGSFSYTPDEGYAFASVQGGTCYTSRYHYLVDWHAPRLRQIKGGDVFVVIDYKTGYYKTISVYWAKDAGTKDPVSGYYQPEGDAKPFKVINLYNASMPSPTPNTSALPADVNHLIVEDSDTAYYWLEQIPSLGNNGTEPGQPPPTAQWTINTYDHPIPSAGITAPTQPKVETHVNTPMYAFESEDISWNPWHMSRTENGVETTVDMVCAGSSNPCFTDEPVAQSVQESSGGKSRTVTTTWQYDTSMVNMFYPGTWLPVSVSYSAMPTGTWDMDGATETYDDNGFLKARTKVVNTGTAGTPHTLGWTYQWHGDGLTRDIGFSVDQKQGSSRTEAYSGVNNVFGQMTLKICGLNTQMLYGDENSGAPWRVRQILRPGDYEELITIDNSVDSQTTVQHWSGWSARFLAGTVSTTTTTPLGGLLVRNVATTDGAVFTNVSGGGNGQLTPWGTPSQYTDSIRQASTSSAFNTSAPNAQGYGTVQSLTDAFANQTTFQNYDWMNRPQFIHALADNYTPSYPSTSKPFTYGITGDGGSKASTATDVFGTLMDRQSLPTQGTPSDLNLDPNGQPELRVGQRSAGVSVLPNGQIQGMSSGLGARGAVMQDIGLDVQGNLAVSTSNLDQNGGGAYTVVTHYDDLGRVVQVDRPGGDGNTFHEYWVYNDLQRSVTYQPGAGPVLKPVVSTVSQDGGTVVVNINGKDIYKHVRSVQNSILKYQTLLYDDSRVGGGGQWTPLTTREIDPAGSTAVTPWSQTANTVSTAASTPGSSMALTSSSDAGTITVTLSHGRPASASVSLLGSPALTLTHFTFQKENLVQASGTMRGSLAGFSLDGDGRLTQLSGPGFNKSISYSSTGDYVATVSDSGVQNTTRAYSTSQAGDFTGVSGTGLLGVSATTQDVGGGATQTTLNGSLTVNAQAGAGVTSKSYSGGPQMSYTYNADGSLASFSEGGLYGTVSYQDYADTVNYGDVSVQTNYYLCGLPSQRASGSDLRTLNWQNGQLAAESHLQGPWQGSAVQRLQDGHGNTSSMGTSLGQGAHNAAGYVCDAVGRPQTVTGSFGGAVYSYDSDTGDLSSLTRGPVVTQYGYDSIGRLTDANTDVAGTHFHYRYTYDEHSRRKTRVTNQGQSWYNLGYDDANELQSVQTSTLGALNYGYDGRGNRISGGSAVIFTIQGADQAVSMSRQNRGYGVSGTVAPGANVRVFHAQQQSSQGDLIHVDPVTGAYSAWWAYAGADGVQRVEMTVRGTLPGAGNSGSNAVADKVLWVSIPSATETLSYDSAARLIGDNTWTIGWDGASRLRTLTRNASTSADPTVSAESIVYGYDAEGRRTSRVHTTTYTSGSKQVESSKMIWNAWLPVCEERTLNGGSVRRRWFTWGRDLSGQLEGAGGIGGLICIQEEGGRTLTPVDDGIGNITAVLDAGSGAVVASYDYGPFGEPLASSGDVDCCPFRWQSKYWDDACGLYYFGYRHYGPKYGRWLSRDPMGEAGGFNLYAYCSNDPVGKWDYLGMDDFQGPVTPEKTLKGTVKAIKAAKGIGAGSAVAVSGALVGAGMASLAVNGGDVISGGDFYERLNQINNPQVQLPDHHLNDWPRATTLDGQPIMTNPLAPRVNNSQKYRYGVILTGDQYAQYKRLIESFGEQRARQIMADELYQDGLDPMRATLWKSDPRMRPGKATGGENLPTIAGKWIRGTEGNAGRFPKQIADQLRGMEFNSFDDFRAAFWEKVAADPVLSAYFKPWNKTLMSERKAPFASPSQVTGAGPAQQVFNMHHILSIENGGGVYDMDNILIVSPRYHQSLHGD